MYVTTESYSWELHTKVTKARKTARWESRGRKLTGLFCLSVSIARTVAWASLLDDSVGNTCKSSLYYSASILVLGVCLVPGLRLFHQFASFNLLSVKRKFPHHFTPRNCQQFNAIASHLCCFCQKTIYLLTRITHQFHCSILSN